MAKSRLKAGEIRVICNNCFYQLYSYRDETGFVKYQCPKCGTVTASKVVGRRHVQIDMYAPKGQVLIEGEQ